MPVDAPVINAVPRVLWEVMSGVLHPGKGPGARDLWVWYGLASMSLLPAFRTDSDCLSKGRSMIKIGFVVSPGFELMSLAATSVFEFANCEWDEPIYDVRIVSEFGGPVANSLGISMETLPFGRMAFDTLIVAGPPTPRRVSEGVAAYLRRAAGRVRRVASICTGAFTLA